MPPSCSFKSSANKKQKNSVFCTYVFRTLNIYSDFSFLKKELNYLNSITMKRVLALPLLIKLSKNELNLSAILLLVSHHTMYGELW